MSATSDRCKENNMSKQKDRHTIGGSHKARDTDWRTYEVLQAGEGLPDVGSTFRSWAWGMVYHLTEGLPNITIDVSKINGWIQGGHIKIVAPARLAGAQQT